MLQFDSGVTFIISLNALQQSIFQPADVDGIAEKKLEDKPMMLAQTIHQHVMNFPPEKQAEILDFVLFLEQKLNCRGY